MSIFAWKMATIIMLFIMIIMLTFLFAEILSDEIEDERTRDRAFCPCRHESEHPFMHKLACLYIKHRDSK